MASYRPFPSHSSFAGPPQAQLHPSQPLHGSQYTQNWSFNTGDGSIPSSSQNYNPIHQQNSNFHSGSFGSSSSYVLSHQQQYYQPPESTYVPQPPLPPPPSMNMQQYYPSSQYSHITHQPQQPPLQPQPPPPPPPVSPPNSSIPPPPSSPPPTVRALAPVQPNHIHMNAPAKVSVPEYGPLYERSKQPKHQSVKKSNKHGGIVETEEERKLRKKREMEKQRNEHKNRQYLRESQNTILQKTQSLAYGHKGHGSVAGARMGEKRSTSFLSSERTENRLKKPTTFLCRMKFRNELPDPCAQPKLMSLKTDKERFTKYAITSLEKRHKPELFFEPDLGIPLDLLDLSVYNAPSTRVRLDPEDEELLQDNEPKPPVKNSGIKRKERPTDKGVSWLVKTQYISSVSMDSARKSLTEKQAKELRETKGGRNILDNFSSRESRIRAIEASFEASKSHPVHSTNSKLKPVEVLPLFPDFDRFEEQFLITAFDSAPTSESEIYSILDESVSNEHESKAIMKSYVATGADPNKPEKFLAYMVPSVDELGKDLYDEHEDISYSWVREYHWDVKGEDDPTTYLVSFGAADARYLPLSKKLFLRKKRAEGKLNDEAEQFPTPSSVTVRWRPNVAAIEMND